RQRPVKDASERESESRSPVIDKRCLMLFYKHEERDYSPRPAPECSCQALKTSPNSLSGISSSASRAAPSATASTSVNIASSSFSIFATLRKTPALMWVAGSREYFSPCHSKENID